MQVYKECVDTAIAEAGSHGMLKSHFKGLFAATHINVSVPSLPPPVLRFTSQGSIQTLHLALHCDGCLHQTLHHLVSR